MKEEKYPRIIFRVSIELKKRLEKEAKKKGITISALIRGKVEGREEK